MWFGSTLKNNIDNALTVAYTTLSRHLIYLRKIKKCQLYIADYTAKTILWECILFIGKIVSD